MHRLPLRGLYIEGVMSIKDIQIVKIKKLVKYFIMIKYRKIEQNLYNDVR